MWPVRTACANPPYWRIGAGAAVVTVVSRGPDGLALDPPAGCVQPGLLTTCQPVGFLPWCGSKEARSRSGPEIRHARRGHTGTGWGGSFMVAVMIGVDPHKGSHTAVAI